MNIKRNIIFSPESRKKDGVVIEDNVPIRMRVVFGGQRVDFSTGYRIDTLSSNQDAGWLDEIRNRIAKVFIS